MLRVTNDMTYTTLKHNIMLNSQGIYELQARASSGKKLLAPSDDPAAFSDIRRLHDERAGIYQYGDNADNLTQGLVNTEGVLQGVSDILHRALELTIESSDGTKTDDDREAMAKEVNLLLEGMVDMANANPSGHYLFAGLRTDTPPYALTRDAAGLITGVTYQGNTGVRQVELGRDVYVEANVPGTDLAGEKAVFQTQYVDIFNSMIQLRDRLNAGENTVDPETFTADPATDTLTVSKTYATGSLVYVESEGTAPGGLVSGQQYYAISVSPTEIRLATSLENARAGVFVDMTDAGTGTHKITQQSLEELNLALDHVLRTLATVGAHEERAELNQNILDQRDLAVENQLSSKESVDVAEIVMELAKRQVAYEAALRVTAGTLQDSLVNLL